MCCEAGNIAANKPKPFKIRLIAMLLCVCFIAALLLSALFILTHAQHEHDHDGADGSCATCAHMTALGNLLKQLSTPVVTATTAMGALFAIRFSLKPRHRRFVFSTLVILKVRLNN
ncbi:MAG: hypothetical protein LBT22_01300 [Peptococcaceae bacterium]|jgi:hypothetical protein|nr:hypothetical protein [Peptococcaceae bacterium]